jgi:N-acetylneuraminate synthase
MDNQQGYRPKSIIMKPVYIIAEIGINHNGDINIAKRLIDISAAAGCNAVKFQKRNPDVCVPEHQKNVLRDTPWGKMTYLEYKYKVEFNKEEYDEIDSYCKQQGIAWSASPWDIDSLKFLEQYDLPFIKIPSAMITNKKLIKAAGETGKKIIISTGMSTPEEIDEAVHELEVHCEYKDIAILHCNSTYPAPLNELNLSCIKTLKEKYKHIAIGYSGHEFRLGTSVSAVYFGAEIIERHVTLDRTMWGSDHMCSLEPQGLFKLVSGIRELEQAHGDGKIKVTDSEKPVRKKLRG